MPGAVRGGPGGEGGGDHRGEPAAPVLRGDLDGGDPGPARRHGHPPDGDGVAGGPDRGERLPGRGGKHLPGDQGQRRLAAVVVQAQPGVIGLGIHPDGWPGPGAPVWPRGAGYPPRRGGHDRRRAGSHAPAPPGEEAADRSRLRPARRVGDSDHGGQAAGLVPVTHRRGGPVQRAPGITGSQGTVRPSGEPARGAQQPVAQPVFLRRPPAERRPLLEIGDRDGHGPQGATPADPRPVGPVMPELIRGRPPYYAIRRRRVFFTATGSQLASVLCNSC